MSANWAVGHNMPGYLPEGDVGVHASWADAQQDLIDDLRRNLDDAYHEAEFESDRQAGLLIHDGTAALAEARALEPGAEFSTTIGNLAFWLMATDEEPEGE